MHILVFSKKVFLIFSVVIFFVFCFLIFKYFSLAVTTSSNVNPLQEKLNSLFHSNQKVAYLTFDDGPTKKATHKILDILKKENVKASFFVIGKYVKNHPELVKRAYEEGHYIANHTYDHNNSKLYSNKNTFIDEIKNTDAEISKAIGVENYTARIFRFPNGYASSSKKYKYEKKLSVSYLDELGYSYIDWNCLNKDSEKKYTKEQLLSNLKSTCKNKDTLVVLMHDTTDVSDSSSVLEDSILFLKNSGYIFKNFYDL